MTYLIPTNTNPLTNVCAVIPIPNDPQWIAQFQGALWELASWWNWERDSLKQGTVIARRWRESIDLLTIGECPVPTEYQMPSCGLIQFSTDGGETWQTMVDFSNCFPWRTPDSELRNTIQSAGDWTPFSWKRRLNQLEPMNKWYDDAGVLQARMTKDFEMQFRGVGNTQYNAIVGRAMFGWNMRQNPAGGIERLDTTLSGFGWFAQGASDNFLQLYAQRPAGSLLQLMTVFVSSDAPNSNITFRARLIQAGALSGAGFAFRSQSQTRVTTSSELVSGQTVDIHQNMDALLNVLSGVDKYAFYYTRLSSGMPTQADAKNGAIAVDVTTPRLWFKLSDGWHTTPDATGITEVDIINLPCGSLPEAAIDGNTLTLSLPEAACPIEPDPPLRFYHKERARPAPGGNDYVEFMIRAEEYITLPWQLENGDALLIAVVEGWWTDQDFSVGSDVPAGKGYEGSGRVMFSGIPGDFIYVFDDPDPDAPHMALLTAYHSMSAPTFRHIVENGSLDIENIDPDAKYAWLQANTNSIAQRNGALHVGVYMYAVEEQPTSVCAGEYDFETGQHDWRVTPSYFIEEHIPSWTAGGEYVDGVGFVSTSYHEEHKAVIIDMLCENVFEEVDGLHHMTMHGNSNGAVLHMNMFDVDDNVIAYHGSGPYSGDFDLEYDIAYGTKRIMFGQIANNYETVFQSFEIVAI